jgi:glutamate-1-semialdehyde aminotransferase
MARKETTEQIAGYNWSFDTAFDSYSYEAIATAAALETLKTLKRTNILLEQLRGRMDSLGIDGLHEILRHERDRIRRAKRLRQAKIAAKRRRTIAAKKAAAQP